MCDDTDLSSEDLSVEEAWKQEIARRLRELDSGSVKTIAWEDVRRQLRARFEE
jgi:putative addiction module component (TIGR02574 family)